jgi:hypothetical protein
MLTIGLPGFLAFAFYYILFVMFWRLAAGFLVKRNPESSLARAMLFVG